MRQEQFLQVVDREEAERRFRAALELQPLGVEVVPLAAALGRVLAEDVVAPVDVPAFDRANVDGFAVRAADTFGASEEHPRQLSLSGPPLTPGRQPHHPLLPGQAQAIATGAMLPRGADAVVLVEHTETEGESVWIHRPVTPGENLTFAGTDIGRGETVLRRGEVLTSRETGVLAALGLEQVRVWRRPRVAILSTGDELVAPGQTLPPGCIYDSNATVLADAVRELGGEPVSYGIVPDKAAALLAVLRRAVAECDVVLLSGGTSKGEGDVSYRAVQQLGPPGILVHGVALKPGKPLCLAAVRRPLSLENVVSKEKQAVVPVVILPGFPTSALFTFQEFVAPVLRRLAGRSEEDRPVVTARLPMRLNSERGRTEYVLVGLVPAVEAGDLPAAYPLGKGSGSVTAFSRADGFIIIPRQQEYVPAGSTVAVQLLSRTLRPADLVVIGSHCLGLDYLLGRLHEQGYRSKFLAVGSSGGLEAARRSECDLAGIHLYDPASGCYNRPFLTTEVVLVPGYRRLQGIVYRPGDARFEGRSIAQAVAQALADPACVLVNRNRGSGTRALIEELLAGARPPGYATEARSHHAVAAAVAQGRADWGVAIAPVARAYHLGFLPLREEQYDFLVPQKRWSRPAVQAFRQLLVTADVQAALTAMGFVPAGSPAE